MPEITTHVSNVAFRQLVVQAVSDESFEVVSHLIIDLVEIIAGDPEANKELKHLVEIINGYIAEEE